MIVTLTDVMTGEQFRYPSHHAPSDWTVAKMRELGLVMTVEQVH